MRPIAMTRRRAVAQHVLHDMTVAEVMHPGVLTCAREAPLTSVAELMNVHHVHCVVVADISGPDEAGPYLWGVVSDLDLVAAALVRELEAQTAGGSAASPVLIVAPDETVERAAQLMTEHQAAHLIVVDPQGHRPVGVISTLDVAKALADSTRAPQGIRRPASTGGTHRA